MNWDDFFKCWSEAKTTMTRADNIADQMATMLVGRLRRVNRDNLERRARLMRTGRRGTLREHTGTMNQIAEWARKSVWIDTTPSSPGAWRKSNDTGSYWRS